MSSPIIPPKDDSPFVSLTLRIRQSMLDRLEYIVKATGHNRHRILVTLLEWAIASWERDNRRQGPGNGGSSTPPAPPAPDDDF